MTLATSSVLGLLVLGGRLAGATLESKVEACVPPPVIVKGEAVECRTISQRMAELHVPGVSIAVLHHGLIEWAKGYGVKSVGGELVTAETIFQAGSISKPVAAMAALHFVQEGKLGLDADVNSKLTTWKVPSSAAAPDAKVTLRELLTHTAGFTVHGFPGYAAGAPVPTLKEVLNGQAPANTAAIRLESVPGSKWNYSGGGFTVMQQLVLDVAKEPFAQLLQETVLGPIGMTHSTYEQPLPEARRGEAAMPFNEDGTAVQGGPHTYPERAAAGLWTTPSDLCRYILEVQRSLEGHANHVLSQEMTRQMLRAGKGDWGLGVQMGGAPARRYFTHGGVNEGYESLFVAYERGGEGAVVMTNAQGGLRLADEVMGGIAMAYDWSADFRPEERSEIKVTPAILGRYVGTYEFTPQLSFTFTLEGDRLMAETPHQPKVPVYAESERKFFLKVAKVEVEFFTNDKGQLSYLILRQGGHEMKAMKK